MIQLFIDHKTVSLPEDVGFDLEIKNPFFSKEGAMTYDIEINLRDGNNARIYRHIDRPAMRNARPSGRLAEIFDNGRLLVRGTEVVLSVDDKIVKIQIVGANSELNYLSGENVRIRELNLFPFGPYIGNDDRGFQINSYYPYADYNECPIYIPYSIDGKDGYTLWNYEQEASFRYQPYVIGYVERIIEILGYKVGIDELRNVDAFCRIFLVNAVPGDDFAKFLPDWTADEFLTEVEHFFNCVFIVNQDTKTVDIRLVKNFYKNKTPRKLAIVEDEHELEFDDDEDNLYITYKNVKYDFPGDSLYKHMDLDNEVERLCEMKNVRNMAAFMAMDLENLYDQWFIFHLIDENINMVITKDTVSGGYRGTIVNQFAAIEDDRSEDECVLKIVPTVDFPTETATGIATIPVANNAPAVNVDATSNKGLITSIVNGVEKEDTPDRMMVSCFLGRHICPDYNGTFLFPVSASFPYYIYNKKLYSHASYMPFSLSLSGHRGMYENFYSGNENIDTTTKRTFRFRTNEIHDVKDVFLIDNNRYYCKKMKYSVENGRLKDIVEGEFFPMD